MGEAAMEGYDEVVDELLALPPESFTEHRNAAVKALRAEGRRDAADAVKALSKPPVALWALNRLATEQPALIDAFLGAAGELRDAYRHGGDIRAATRPERDAEARVVAAATELVRKHGRAVTEAVLQGLGQTVHAAAASAEVAEALRSGRLLREPEAPSIDALLGSMPEPASVAKAPATDANTATADTVEAERLDLLASIADAELEAERARADERSAARAAAEAHESWKVARGTAEESERNREEAEERLDELRKRLARL